MRFFVADVIVKIPGCYGVEEGSWAWWLHGCWLFQVEVWLPLGLSVTAALLAAAALRHLRRVTA